MMEIQTPLGASIRHARHKVDGTHGVILSIAIDDRYAEVWLSMKNVWDLVIDLETEYL